MIRPYKSTDRKRLIEIFKLNTPLYFDPKEVSDFEEYLDIYGTTYLTIEYDDKIVGGIGYQFTDNNSIGTITWVFFHPDYSSLGLGRQSVEYCLAILKLNPNTKKLVVTTSQLAYKFFAKFGFKLIKTEKDYWGQKLDLYLMEMDVNK